MIARFDLFITEVHMGWCIPDLDAPKTRVVELSVALRASILFSAKRREQDIHQGRWAIIHQSREVRTTVTTELVSRELFYRDKSFLKISQRHERILRRDGQIGEPCGQHEEFAKEKRHAESMREKCRAAP